MFCNNCRIQLKTGTLVCSNCGAAVGMSGFNASRDSVKMPFSPQPPLPPLVQPQAPPPLVQPQPQAPLPPLVQPQQQKMPPPTQQPKNNIPLIQKAQPKAKSKKNTVIVVVIITVIILAIAATIGFNIYTEAERAHAVAQHLDLGERYLLDLNYEQALVHFLQVIDIEPKNPRGYTGAAESHLGLEQYDEAIAILEQGLEALPEGDGDNIAEMLEDVTIIGNLSRGERYLQDYNYNEALPPFLTVIELDPMNPRGYTGAADAHVGLGQYCDAADILRQGLEQLPDEPTIVAMYEGLRVALTPYRTGSGDDVSHYLSSEARLGGESFDSVFSIGNGREILLSLNNGFSSVSFITGVMDGAAHGGAIEIYGDGNLLYSAPWLPAGSPNIEVSFNTSGVDILRIVGVDSFASVANIIGLGILTERTPPHIDGDELPITGIENTSAGFFVLNVRHVYADYRYFLGMALPCIIFDDMSFLFQPNNQYETFSFYTGARDCSRLGGGFRIYGDGELIYTVSRTQPEDGLVRIDVDISGVIELEIVSNENYASILVPGFSVSDISVAPLQVSFPDSLISSRFVRPAYSEFTDFYGLYDNHGQGIGVHIAVNVHSVLIERTGLNSFVSLPIDSYVKLGFSRPLVNVPGGIDLVIVTTGNIYEEADVYIYGEDGREHFVGRVIEYRDVLHVDFGDIDFPVVAVRIIGQDEGGASPGFDVVEVFGWTAG